MRCAGCGLVNAKGLVSCRRCGGVLGAAAAPRAAAPRIGWNTPIRLSEVTKATLFAAIAVIGFVLAVGSAFREGRGLERQISGRIERCQEFRRGLQHEIQISLDVEPHDVFVSDPKDALASVADACRSRARVELTTLSDGFIRTTHQVIAMKAEGHGVFDRQQFLVARKGETRARYAIIVFLAVVVVAAAFGLQNARKQTAEREN